MIRLFKKKSTPLVSINYYSDKSCGIEIHKNKLSIEDKENIGCFLYELTNNLLSSNLIDNISDHDKEILYAWSILYKNRILHPMVLPLDAFKNHVK